MTTQNKIIRINNPVVMVDFYQMLNKAKKQVITKMEISESRKMDLILLCDNYLKTIEEALICLDELQHEAL